MIEHRPQNLNRLTHAFAEEFLEHLHLSESGFLQWFLSPFIKLIARRFARLADEYGQRIAYYGFSEATNWFSHCFLSELFISGHENVPKSGPLLIVSNHAGGIDVLAIIASIPRNDLTILADQHPTLDAMPDVDKHISYTGSSVEDRPLTIRAIIRRLEEEKSVLLFPAGLLEPDPRTAPGALVSLRSWSPSLGIFFNKVPQTQLLPVTISGVVSPPIYNSIFARKRETQKNRQKTALLIQTALQMIHPALAPIQIHVDIGSPIMIDQITDSTDPKVITDQIIGIQKSLMETSIPEIV